MTPTKIVSESQPLLPYLLATWPEVKRTKVKQWLKYDSVYVNDVVVTQHDYELSVGDRVSIQPTKAPPPTPDLPEGMRVLYEDADIIVIHKPVNLLTIATETEQDRTAYNAITLYVRDRARTGMARIWVVHRLDRETSGVLLFAKTEEAKETLQADWQNFEKRYLALVEGKLPANIGTLRAHIDESQPHRVFTHVSAGPGTREAITNYRVLRQGMGRTLIELTLETGRRHQIRVQLAEVGCPIVGDKKYGAQSNPARRVALHAAMLKIQHPRTGKDMVFESPLPEVLVRLLPSAV